MNDWHPHKHKSELPDSTNIQPLFYLTPWIRSSDKCNRLIMRKQKLLLIIYRK